MNVSEYRAMQANAMTEDELLDQVVTLARDLGWLVFHDQDSRRNAAGLPDLILVRDRLIFAELKRQRRAQLRPAQREWGRRLSAIADRTPFVEAHLWRPINLFDGSIAATLAPSGQTGPDLLGGAA